MTRGRLYLTGNTPLTVFGWKPEAVGVLFPWCSMVLLCLFQPVVTDKSELWMSFTWQTPLRGQHTRVLKNCLRQTMTNGKFEWQTCKVSTEKTQTTWIRWITEMITYLMSAHHWCSGFLRNTWSPSHSASGTCGTADKHPERRCRIHHLRSLRHLCKHLTAAA